MIIHDRVFVYKLASVKLVIEEIKASRLHQRMALSIVVTIRRLLFVTG